MNRYSRALSSILVFCFITIFAEAKGDTFSIKAPVLATGVKSEIAWNCHGCVLPPEQAKELHTLVHEYRIALSNFCDLVCSKETQFKRQPFKERAHFLKEGAQKLLRIIDKIESFYKRVGVPECCQQGVINDMKTQVFDWLARPQDFTGLKATQWWGPEKLYGWSEAA